MTVAKRTINVWPPLYFIFIAEGVRGAMPVRRVWQAFGAGYGGLLLEKVFSLEGQVLRAQLSKGGPGRYVLPVSRVDVMEPGRRMDQQR